MGQRGAGEIEQRTGHSGVAVIEISAHEFPELSPKRESSVRDDDIEPPKCFERAFDEPCSETRSCEIAEQPNRAAAAFGDLLGDTVAALLVVARVHH
jgi:hypothetical protein